MPAATPQQAQADWEANTAAGISKYRAKVTQMQANYAAGLQRFWGTPVGPVTSTAYSNGIQGGAERLAAGVQGKGAKWLSNSRAGIQR